MLPLLLLACRSEESPHSATTVRFDPGDAPLDYGAVPFPSDLYRDDDGRLALGALPNAMDGEPALVALRELVAGRDGFCGTCAIRFAVDGGLGSVPAELPPVPGAPVVLADLDAGALLPIRTEWDADSGWLVVRPAPGVVLPGGHRIAAALTDGLRGNDRLPLSPATAFAAVRDGDPRADARATEILDPALDALQRLGIPRDRVVGLAAFATEDPARALRAVREQIRARAPARAEVDRVWVGEALDGLLGVPVDDRAGADVPPAEGTDGRTAVRHATTRVMVTGRFSAARFVEGSGTEVGALQTDADGFPFSAVDDSVPFVLIVPEGADVGRLPVIVAHHGFNASRTTAFVLADTAGAAGFAILGIDAYQHGARAASAADQRFNARDLPGEDGFAETSELDVSARVFGLLGTPPELRMAAGFPLGAFTQFAADALSAVALVEDGDWSEIAAADPSLEGLGFDPDRIGYLGNSMGAVIGAGVVAVEPDVGLAVLNVLPGNIVDTLAESGEFRPLSESLLLPAIGVDGPFDEPKLALALDPTVDLFRWALEPVDPLALAPGWLARPDPPSVLIQLAGHDEVAAPGPSESVVAAAGIGGVGTFALAPVDPVGIEASAVAVRWDGAMHGMLEVRWQSSAWEEPLVQPLVPRPSAEVLENPIDAVHAEITAALEAFREGGRGALRW